MSAKQILRVEDNGEKKTLQLNEENLRQLRSEDIANLPVVVIPVTGAYRTGKSFLLNSMMQYITASEKSRWLEKKCESFQWKGGCEPHTNGLVMSPPTKIKLPSGETAVLLLMDTQGLFDGTSSASDMATFSLSALISSLLVSNVMHDLKGSDLEYQQLFTEIGRLVGDTTEGKPFQDLCFLIRDWQHKQDYSLGGQGGTRLIEKRLESNIENISKQRKQFKECFANVSGFLLPHPGKAVAESPAFDGDAEDMDPEFRSTLEEFMVAVLSPDKLKVKMNGDRPTTCAQLATFIEIYVERLQNEGLVKAESIREAFARATNFAVLEDEFCRYVKQMEDLLADSETLLDPRVFQEKHNKTVAVVLKSLNSRKFLRDPALSREDYIFLLKAKMESWFQSTVKLHERFEEDKSKARDRIEKIFNDCITTYTEHIASLTRNSTALYRLLPSREKTIRDIHTEAKEHALKHFSEKRHDIGGIGSEKVEKELEKVLDGFLTEAIDRNTKVQICWVAVGVVCVVIGGVVVWYYGLTILEVLRRLARTATDLIRFTTIAGDVLCFSAGVAQFAFTFLSREKQKEKYL